MRIGLIISVGVVALTLLGCGGDSESDTGTAGTAAGGADASGSGTASDGDGGEVLHCADVLPVADVVEITGMVNPSCDAFNAYVDETGKRLTLRLESFDSAEAAIATMNSDRVCDPSDEVAGAGWEGCAYSDYEGVAGSNYFRIAVEGFEFVPTPDPMQIALMDAMVAAHG